MGGSHDSGDMGGTSAAATADGVGSGAKPLAGEEAELGGVCLAAPVANGRIPCLAGVGIDQGRLAVIVSEARFDDEGRDEAGSSAVDADGGHLGV